MFEEQTIFDSSSEDSSSENDIQQEKAIARRKREEKQAQEVQAHVDELVLDFEERSSRYTQFEPSARDRILDDQVSDFEIISDEQKKKEVQAVLRDMSLFLNMAFETIEGLPAKEFFFRKNEKGENQL